jgi:hypothetical protein
MPGPIQREEQMSKNQGRILDIGVSAGGALASCVLLHLVDFHPAYVFVALVIAGYGKLTLKRRVQGLRNYIKEQRQ